MAKLTLLEFVQDILNDTDSDNVNSIDDTVESQQVAQIVKTTYFRLMSKQDWPFLRTLTSLTGLGDTNNPTKMLIPETVNKVLWIKYDGNDVTYLEPKKFKDTVDLREAITGVVDSNGFIINANPSYWTTYDDVNIVFDGYNSTVESTLQTSKAVAYCQTEPTWSHTDSFVPTMPAKMFPTMLADAKGTAFIVLKQQQNAKEEAIAKTGRSQMQDEARRAVGEHLSNRDVNYGRK
jgi:hypothetical protein